MLLIHILCAVKELTDKTHDQYQNDTILYYTNKTKEKVTALFGEVSKVFSGPMSQLNCDLYK